MDQLIYFGTGHAMTRRIYQTCFSLTDGDQHFMVDAGGGNGILAQLEDAGLSSHDLSDIFISHLHSDHVLGAVWLARVAGQHMKSGAREKPLTFYAQENVLTGFKQICDVVMAKSLLPLFGNQILLEPVKDGQSLHIGSREITFFDIGPDKVLQYGFHTTLMNGDTLTFLGDEPLHPAGEVYAKGATHLIHEAFCLESEISLFDPHGKAHSTVRDASENAERMGVKHLILCHTEENHLNSKSRIYRQEAEKHFHGKVSVPNDLDRVQLSLD